MLNNFPGAGVSGVAGKIPEVIKNQPKLNQSIWGQMIPDIKRRRGVGFVHLHSFAWMSSVCRDYKVAVINNINLLLEHRGLHWRDGWYGNITKLVPAC